MTLTVLVIVAVAAFFCAILAAIGKCPLWVAVVLLSIFALLTCLSLDDK